MESHDFDKMVKSVNRGSLRSERSSSDVYKVKKLSQPVVSDEDSTESVPVTTFLNQQTMMSVGNFIKRMGTMESDASDTEIRRIDTIKSDVQHPMMPIQPLVDLKADPSQPSEQ